MTRDASTSEEEPMSDDAHDQVLTYPSDAHLCAVCGLAVIAWPEGLHHSNEALDRDHDPVILEDGPG